MIYIYWMELRRKRYEHLDAIAFKYKSREIKYIESWNEAKAILCLDKHTIRFDNFMVEILQIDRKNIRKIYDILKDYEPPLWKRFFRWFGIYIS